MRAKDYLEQVNKTNELIKNKQIDAEFYRSIAEGAGSISDGGDKIKSSPRADKMENAICKCIEVQREIDEQIIRLVSLRHEITKTIEQLPAQEYDILYQIYVQGRSFLDIAEERDKGSSAIRKVHSQGVRLVQQILDARGNGNV